MAKHVVATGHGGLFKAASITASASVVQIFFGVIRAKAVALLIGTAGVGTLGLCQSAIELGTTVFGMGLRTSAVRVLSGSDEASEHAIRHVLLLLSLLLGLLGCLAFVVFRESIASFTFGDDSKSWLVSLLGMAVGLGVLGRYFAAVLQGLSRIRSLAVLAVATSVSATLLGVPIVAFLGEDGIGPMVVVVAVAGVVSGAALVSKVERSGSTRPGKAVLWNHGSTMIGHGFVLMLTAVASVGAAYLLRVMLKAHLGVGSVGLFSAAYTLASLYVGFILQAMSADYFPRLSALADSSEAMVELVNRQLEVSLLLAGAGLVATIAFADIIVWAFYSSEFEGAASLLQWQVLGAFGRVVSWPLSFVLLARAIKIPYVLAEVSASAVYLAAAWMLVDRLGLDGVGVAFLVMYLYYAALMRWIVGREICFSFSLENRRLLSLLLVGVLLAFLLSRLEQGSVRWSASAIVVSLSVYCALAGINRRTNGAVLERIRNVAARLH